jgi:protocatechuate 3,4-dioxygenase beta subunit
LKEEELSMIFGLNLPNIMKSTKNKNRRQFLKNTSLAVLGVGAIPSLLKATSPEEAVAACDPTTLDYYGEGPFYKTNPPVISGNQLASSTEVGSRMVISGRVRNLDCSKVIPNTIIDVWHANNAGQYDNSAYNLRGKTTSNSQGFYIFETIKPGKYLNGSKYRPSTFILRLPLLDLVC